MGKQTKIFSPYPECHKVRSTISEFFRSIDKGRMWWYNIIGGNEGSISYFLRLDPITAGSILITDNLVALKRGSYEPILAFKRTEWRKFIDYFGLSIEVNPSNVGKITHIFSVFILYQALHMEIPI